MATRKVDVRKISISLPSGLYKLLDQWADKEGTTPTSLATELISNLIREEIRQGRLSYDDDNENT